MNYQIYRAEVIAARRLTPGMVRVTLGGEDLSRFTTTGVGDEYLRVFFPHGEDRREVSLPLATADGGWDWPEGAAKSPLRTYTVRDIRRNGGGVELDIDFVVHDGGIAATWAQRAAPGDVVGLNNPNPLYDPPDNLDWQFLIADQAGLPAAGRLLAATPSHVRTKVVIEVPDAEHHSRSPPDRSSKSPGSTAATATDPAHWTRWSAPHPPLAPTRVTLGRRRGCMPVGCPQVLRHELGLPADRYKGGRVLDVQGRGIGTPATRRSANRSRPADGDVVRRQPGRGRYRGRVHRSLRASRALTSARLVVAPAPQRCGCHGV